MKILHASALFTLGAGLLFWNNSAARAQTATAQFLYHVTMDTTQLEGHPAGPFSLQFTFLDGSAGGDGSSGVLVTNFNFGANGDVEGNAEDDSSAGDLLSGVTLTNTTPECDFSEVFDAGSTLTFDIHATLTLSGSGSDELDIAILDSEGLTIPTLDTNDDNALIRMTTLDGVSITVETYGTDPGMAPLASGPPVSFGPQVLLDGTFPPVPPILTISQSIADGTDTIQWPAVDSSFTLQESPDLFHWTEVAITPALVNTNSTVVVFPVDAPMQFYRLAQ
jgi:hypothetical protein